MKALTVRQPWAQLIAKGGKTIENRTWQTSYRGPLLIQSSTSPISYDLKQIEKAYSCRIDHADLHRGVTVAVADLTDIVTEHHSKWFKGPFGWVLENIKPMPPIPMKGRLSLFDVPPDLRAAIKKHLKR